MGKITHLALNEEGFIFDPETGNSYTTNKTGLWIIKRLQEGLSPEQIVTRLAEEFEVSPEEAERDLYEFLEVLKALGLWEDRDG